jgi:transposase
MTIRKSYTEEFKREAIRLAIERGNVSATARDLGISDTTLQNWTKQLQQTPENAFPGNGNPRDKETAQLQRENRRLREENEILKKAVGIFTVRPQ